MRRILLSVNGSMRSGEVIESQSHTVVGKVTEILLND